jgi:hypothetical protein
MLCIINIIPEELHFGFAAIPQSFVAAVGNIGKFIAAPTIVSHVELGQQLFELGQATGVKCQAHQRIELVLVQRDLDAGQGGIDDALHILREQRIFLFLRNFGLELQVALASRSG